jgi:hypothetical protein
MISERVPGPAWHGGGRGADESRVLIENRTFEEIALGASATLARTLSREDIELFVVMSGDVNPCHHLIRGARSRPAEGTPRRPRQGIAAAAALQCRAFPPGSGAHRGCSCRHGCGPPVPYRERFADGYGTVAGS